MVRPKKPETATVIGSGPNGLRAVEIVLTHPDWRQQLCPAVRPAERGPESRK
jgi:hypothetical protein